MRPTRLLSTVLLLAATSSAWPWPPAVWKPAVDVAKRQIAPLVARQDSSATPTAAQSTQESASATTTEDASSKNDATTTTDASNSDASTTGSPSGSATDKSSGESTITSSAQASDSSGKSSTTASKTTFSANLPAGGISMVTPNAHSTSYYKIGQPVTFAWNYTSLSVTPTAVDVLAVASANSQTYTIATNQTIPNATQTVVWDTGAYESSVGSALPMATYTLIVYDAESSVSATAEPGYLGVSDTFTFGMYQPQSYENSAVEYQCITCSSDAMVRMQRMTVGFVFSMAALTVLSFTWFAGVAGIL
ncbi:AGA1 A-agglutinin anchor subunit [Teratosphaeria destructans]|uniref:AGA1 A-agglutinin anchor subunit n=1 Tax=Teratosphaeria destructans TaxID=418781 RepID=A0A9W7SQ51_9PEZI|nr:AGA1 A-agglutinin anchor subunit [Teratosphaeria destructans]